MRASRGQFYFLAAFLASATLTAPSAFAQSECMLNATTAEEIAECAKQSKPAAAPKAKKNAQNDAWKAGVVDAPPAPAEPAAQPAPKVEAPSEEEEIETLEPAAVVVDPYKADHEQRAKFREANLATRAVVKSKGSKSKKAKVSTTGFREDENTAENKGDTAKVKFKGKASAGIGGSTRKGSGGGFAGELGGEMSLNPNSDSDKLSRHKYFNFAAKLNLDATQDADFKVVTGGSFPLDETGAIGGDFEITANPIETGFKIGPKVVINNGDTDDGDAVTGQTTLKLNPLAWTFRSAAGVEDVTTEALFEENYGPFAEADTVAFSPSISVETRQVINAMGIEKFIEIAGMFEIGMMNGFGRTYRPEIEHTEIDPVTGETETTVAPAVDGLDQEGIGLVTKAGLRVSARLGKNSPVRAYLSWELLRAVAEYKRNQFDIYGLESVSDRPTAPGPFGEVPIGLPENSSSADRAAAANEGTITKEHMNNRVTFGVSVETND